MSKENKTNTPRRGPVFEKPKNFKESIKRLFKELSNFKMLLILSLLLSSFSSVLSIASPNKLSDLTDEISKGLVVNTENLEKITSEITYNFKRNNFKDIEIDGVNITYYEQLEFYKIISKINDKSDINKVYELVDEMPSNIQKVINPKMNMEAIKKITARQSTKNGLNSHTPNILFKRTAP